MTQRAMAAALGVGQPAVSRIETRPDQKMSTLARYAEALGGRLRVTIEVGGRDFDLEPDADEPRRRPPRRMRVIWQDAQGQFRHVGDLHDDGVVYRFQYVDPPDLEGWRPFPAFPDVDQVYESETLWPFFNQRQAATLGVLLGDESRPLPMVELAADEASLDGKLQLVPDFSVAETGDAWTFLASGVSHNEEDAEPLLQSLQPGDRLSMHRAFDYDRSESHARRLRVGQTSVGWLPDYAVKDVDRLEALGHRLAVEVLRVQPPGGNPHLRLLCRLSVEV